jgi:hypothetical protein
MAQHYTDFSGALSAVDRTWSLTHLEVPQNPDRWGFHDAWDAGNFTVQEFGGEKVIRHQKTSTNARSALLWPSAGMFADVEVTGMVYIDTSGTGKRPGLILRGSAHISVGAHGYAFLASKATNTIYINRYVNSGSTQLTSTAYTFTTGWYHIKANATGTSLSMRIWKDGDPEPGTWNLTTTDANIAYGYCGVFDYEGSDLVSYFKNLRVVGTPLHHSNWRTGWGDIVGIFPQVISDGSLTGGKGLYLEQKSPAGRMLFLWEDVLPSNDMRVLARFKPSLINSTTYLLKVRAQGYGGYEYGYTVCLRNTSGGLGVFVNYKGDSSSLVTTASSAVSTANNWYKLRFQMIGQDIKVRVWADADPEPGTWNLEISDTTRDSSHEPMGMGGWFGIGSGGSTNHILWDYISVGTDGDDPL